jgi:hypothetical protein
MVNTLKFGMALDPHGISRPSWFYNKTIGRLFPGKNFHLSTVADLYGDNKHHAAEGYRTTVKTTASLAKDSILAVVRHKKSGPWNKLGYTSKFMKFSYWFKFGPATGFRLIRDSGRLVSSQIQHKR